MDAQALSEAANADALLAAGTYLGPLHGIPYGMKDIVSVAPYRTTWGSGAYIDQVRNDDDDGHLMHGAHYIACLACSVRTDRSLLFSQ